MLGFLQKAPLILELFFNGCFILLYSIKRYQVKVALPFYMGDYLVDQFLLWGARIAPFVILFTILSSYLRVFSLEKFFRKYVFSLMVFVPLLITWGDQEFCFWLASVHLLSSVLTLYEDESDGIKRTSSAFLRIFKLNPPQIVLLTFSGLILLGTLLLMLPFSSVSGKTMTLVNAFFMATSATCVTGLSTISVGSDLSLFGQLVILFLVQVGGLGIMILYASMTLFLGRAMPMKERVIMQEILDVSSLEHLIALIYDIIKYTVVIELWGAIILTVGFYSEGFEFGRALYLALFHSISAFCNAGLSVFDNSLESFATSPMIHFTVASLITLGGLGFVVLREVKTMIVERRPLFNMSLYSKLVLVTSAVLTFGGALFIFFGEFLNALDKYTLWEKIQMAIFQSVTCRTAGYDTVSLPLLSNYTIYFMVILMFIGAASGSTGGGIKVSTFAILFQSIRSILRGQDRVEIFDRTIPNSVVVKSTALSILSFMTCVIFVFVLMRTEPEKSFLALIFETVSAFGTVGLSLGITPYLSVSGKVLIALMMFIGRIGPLTLLVAVGKKKSEVGSRAYPEGRVMIG